MRTEILLGYEVGTGNPVHVPVRHLAVTGQTQQSGKTTTLEALVSRSGGTALTFITKRGESAFSNTIRVTPYFRDRADWQFVTSIIDATLQEKNKFLRPWIMKICRTTRTLADVQARVREALRTAKGINEGVYTQLDAYLDLIVPEIKRARLIEDGLHLSTGINAMDVTEFSVPMQMLFIQSALDYVNQHFDNTIVVVPEAWEFVPESKGSPVKASAIALVRKGAALNNHIWIDSQDMAGVDKTLLRGCTVWLIGAQREANEIKRNLANIPASINRPKSSEIALLERGQFFACFGKTVVKVYVRPAWMDESTAMDIAKGWQRPHSVAIQKIAQPKEPQVNEAEALALRQENADLRAKITDLQRQINKPTTEDGPSSGYMSHSGPLDFDALYETFRTRALRDPVLLQVLVSRPEIEVKVERRTIQTDGSTMKGRVARLLAEGFYDDGSTNSATRQELRRTGPDVNNAALGKVLSDFHHMGFFTLDGDKFRAVPGMKVNIIGV